MSRFHRVLDQRERLAESEAARAGLALRLAESEAARAGLEHELEVLRRGQGGQAGQLQRLVKLAALSQVRLVLKARMQARLCAAVGVWRQDASKAGLVRAQLEDTVSHQAQAEIKAGLVRAQLEGTVGGNARKSITTELEACCNQRAWSPRTPSMLLVQEHARQAGLAQLRCIVQRKLDGLRWEDSEARVAQLEAANAELEARVRQTDHLLVQVDEVLRDGTLDAIRLMAAQLEPTEPVSSPQPVTRAAKACFHQWRLNQATGELCKLLSCENLAQAVKSVRVEPIWGEQEQGQRSRDKWVNPKRKTNGCKGGGGAVLQSGVTTVTKEVQNMINMIAAAIRSWRWYLLMDVYMLKYRSKYRKSL